MVATETDADVLWEATNPGNILRLSRERRNEYVDAFSGVLGRNVAPRAKARATNFLGLLALFGDDWNEIAGHVNGYAAQAEEVALSTYARTVARQLSEGTATVATLAEAFRAWETSQR